MRLDWVLIFMPADNYASPKAIPWFVSDVLPYDFT